jgi:hypothetical protein
MDDPNPQGPCILDITQGPVTVTAVPGLTDPAARNQSASGLLPLPDQHKVLIIGGAPLGATVNATDSADLVDLRAPHPEFTPVAPMGLPRMHLNAVLLPDHTVLVCGGSLQREAATVSRRQAEIYDPATDTWTAAAIATIPRLYHSTAVLLPSGQVVAAGGNPEGGDQGSTGYRRTRTRSCVLNSIARRICSVEPARSFKPLPVSCLRSSIHHQITSCRHSPVGKPHPPTNHHSCVRLFPTAR